MLVQIASEIQVSSFMGPDKQGPEIPCLPQVINCIVQYRLLMGRKYLDTLFTPDMLIRPRRRLLGQAFLGKTQTTLGNCSVTWPYINPLLLSCFVHVGLFTIPICVIFIKIIIPIKLKIKKKYFNIKNQHHENITGKFFSQIMVEI